MKKLLALFMAFTLTFQLVTPVFAEEIEETQAAAEAVEVETEAPVTEVPTAEPPVPETAAPEETSAPTEPQPTTEVTEATETTASTEETTTASTEPTEETTEETTEPALDLFAEDENVIASGICGTNLTWVLTKDGTLNISGNGRMQDFVHGYASNTSAPWNQWQSLIINVYIASKVTSIGSYAFYDCASMKNITIPESIEQIGDHAFYGCACLEEVSIPQNITAIEKYAFYGCSSLESIVIHNNIAEIKERAFSGCSSLRNITLPDSLKTLGLSAFENCVSLAEIRIPASVTTVDQFVFEGCKGLLSLDISGDFGSIGKGMFCGCSGLLQVKIAEGITGIGEFAFENCSSLNSVYIPKSVKLIDRDAFAGCSQIADIYYNGSRNKWSSLRIVSGNSSLTNAEIHCAYVDNGTCGEGLTWLLDNDGVLTISGSGIMRDYSSSSDRTTAPWGTYWKQVNTVRIESGVISVGNFAFAGCGNLKNIELPAGLTSIGESAFSGCSTLPTLSIPKSVTAIGSAAFSGCTSLENIYYEGSLGMLKRMLCYAGVPDGCVLHGTAVDNGTCGDSLAWMFTEDGILTISGNGNMKDYTYSDTPLWNNYQDQITAVVLEPGVASIGDYAFRNCSSLASVVILEGVTSIGNHAFDGCNSLSDVTIPNGVTRIGENAFDDCGSLYSIVIPESVTTIGYHAFYNCESLTDIAFSHRAYDILSIGSGAFSFSSSSDATIFTTVRVPSVKTMHPAIKSYGWAGDRWGTSYRVASFYGDALFPMESLALGTKDGATQYELGTAVEFTVTPEPIDTTDDYALTIVPEKTTAQARLSKDGVLTTLSTGTVTVRAQCVQNPAISDEITVTVLPPTGTLTSLTVTTLNDYPGDAELGKPVQMIPVFTPANAADRSVTWSVENGTGTATIDENGLLTPLTVGTVTVYAMTPGGIEGASTVNIVRYAEEITILLNGKEDISRLGAGESLELYFRLSPEDTTTKEVEWSVTNQTGWAELCTYTYNEGYFKLIGQKAGTVILTATAKDSKQVVTTKELTITDTIRSYALSDGSGNLYYNTETGWITGADETVKNVLIPAQIDGVTIVGIDPYAFTKRDSYNGYVEANTTLTSVSIPNTIVEIGESAFAYCTALSTVRFASGSKLTTIGENAFYQCSSITSLTIPDSVQSIGDKAFCYLENLKYLTVSGELDTTGWLSKDWNGNRCELEKLTLTGQYVCEGIKNTHDWGDDWRSIPGRNAKKVILSEGITAISNGAFSNCSKIEQVVFPSSLKAIGEYAFDDCRSIKQIDFPANLQAIGKRAFSNCSSLTGINLPSSIETLGEECFYSCGNLQVLDMSKVPDTFIEKETRLTGMVTFPTWLVRATNGKAEMYWDMLDDNGYGHARQDSRTKQWYLYAYRVAKGSLICRDSYTGICGSKEIEIKTGIVIRPADTGYLVSGSKLTLSAWDSGKKAKVKWSLSEDSKAYATITGAGVLRAKAVSEVQNITVIATPTDGSPEARKEIQILPKITVKQTEKFNLFYRNGKAKLAITGGQVASARFVEPTDFVLEDSDGQFYIRLAEGASAKPKTKVTLEITLPGCDIPVRQSLTIATTNTAPKLKLNPTASIVNTTLTNSLTVETAILGTEDTLTVRSATKGVTASVDKDILTLTLDNGKTTTATVYLKGSDWAKEIRLTHRITVTDKKPTVKLSAKGKLDVLNPASEIVYTPKLTNATGTITDVRLEGQDANLFNAEVVDGLVHLKLAKSGENYATKKTYKVMPVVTLLGKDIAAPTLSIKVTQSALKLAKLPNRTVYQSQTAPLMVKLAVTSPANAKIGDVQLNAKTTAAFRNVLENAGGIQADEAAVSFPAKAFAALKPGRYTVILDVTPSNAASDTKSTQVRFTLTVQK